jgi:hypothetical protein
MRRFIKQNNEMAISEHELASMTTDLQDAHRDTLPALQSSLAAWATRADAEIDPPRGLSRRSSLTRSGLFAAGGLLVATTGAAAAPSRA